MTAVIVTDLGFGDSGKGTVTDTLVRQLGASWVVRHNGGAQAAHNVVTADGRHHTFSQFGAASFVPNVKTYLSRFMLVHPGGLMEEARVLESKGVGEPLERLFIDPEAKLITPFHQAANRLREILRGDGRHGSCGLGVGETMHYSLQYPEDVVVAGDLFELPQLRRKLALLQQRYHRVFAAKRSELVKDPHGAAEFEILEGSESAERFVEQASLIRSRVKKQSLAGRRVVFEGAQGVLLDEWRGFHPYTTWSTCTFDNALELCQEWGLRPYRLGVIRSYGTRHGAGPFPTYDPNLDLPELHNAWGHWQKEFRLGWLDLPLLRYAVAACGGIDGLAVTHLDYVTDDWQLCKEYEGQIPSLGPFTDLEYQESLTRTLEAVRPRYFKVKGTQDLLRFVAELGPVVLESWGPRNDQKRLTDSSLIRIGEMSQRAC